MSISGETGGKYCIISSSDRCVFYKAGEKASNETNCASLLTLYTTHLDSWGVRKVGFCRSCLWYTHIFGVKKVGRDGVHFMEQGRRYELRPIPSS